MKGVKRVTAMIALMGCVGYYQPLAKLMLPAGGADGNSTHYAL